MNNDTFTAWEDDFLDSFLGAGVYKRINEIVSTFIFPIFLTVCLSGNVINIIVFFKIGLKDSVTISFFTLSLSDLSYLLLNSALTTCRSMVAKYTGNKLEAGSYKTIVNAIRNYQFVFSDYSILITTYIAVTRCSCVAMPFTFKGVFTVYRTYVTLTVIFVINLALKLPMISIIGLALRTDPVIENQLTNDQQAMIEFHDIVNENCLRYLTTCITVICMILLIYKLHVASRDRLKLIISSKFQSSFKVKNNYLNTEGSRSSTRGDANHRNGSVPGKYSNNSTDAKPSGNLSNRDQQVVIVVVLVSAVFVTDVIFSACVALTRLFDQELAPLGSKYDLFAILKLIEYLVKYINAGINLVIYFNFNSKYRHVIEGWFLCVCHESEGET